MNRPLSSLLTCACGIHAASPRCWSPIANLDGFRWRRISEKEGCNEGTIVIDIFPLFATLNTGNAGNKDREEQRGGRLKRGNDVSAENNEL